MATYVGTSGYAYKEWKGAFYPAKLPAAEMLRFYAGRLPTVEINNTFYRMPTERVLVDWADQVPEGFRFVLKAPQRITHFARLKLEDDSLDYFLRTANVMAGKLGPTLFQLPPNFKKDVGLLSEFLALLPPKVTAAFEFRNPSWLGDDVYACLQERNLALCIADSETRDTPIITTADYAYLRLRDEGYTPDDVRRWGDTARELAMRCRDVFVYFKHEDEGKGAAFGTLMREHLAQ